MSQKFSNHLNNYSYDNFTPQATKNRNVNAFLIITFIVVGGVIVYNLKKYVKEEKNKAK